MENFTTFEIAARAVLAKTGDSMSEMMVKRVFCAMYSQALSVEEIETIAKAMYQVTAIDLKPALAKMIKAKILRRNGKRYEVNA